MFRRLRGARRRKDEDFADELEAHIELEIARLVADGSTPLEARSAAMRAFGNVTAAKERFYETSRWMLVEQLVQDFRYAFRNLRQNPTFLATTVLTLGVGLGLVTVVFTVFNTYVLRPFAVDDPASLYRLAWSSQTNGGQGFRWRDYLEVRGRDDIFNGVVAEHTRFVSSNGRPLFASLVSDNFFDVLRPQVRLGHALFADAGTAGGNAAVLSDAGWARLFARDPSAVGRELDINRQPFVVVGVLRPEFSGLDELPRDIWLPVSAYAPLLKPDLVGANQPAAFEITARLRPELAPAQAQHALGAFVQGVFDQEKQVRALVTPHASPNQLSLEMLAVISPVFAAFGLVLVAACANVSNVMLARAIARRREIAVRLSLGASRNRVIRQLLTEGAIIAILSGLAGLALASWTLSAGVSLMFETLPPSVARIMRFVPAAIDQRVYLFALAVSVASILMFALVPALKASRLTLIDALRGHGGAVDRSRLRSGLVIAQVGVSLVLVIVALTLARNGGALGGVDLGYETKGVLSINVRGRDVTHLPALAATLAADPRVQAVAATNGNPLFVRERPIAAAPSAGASARATRYTFVSPEYFPVLDLPITSGRGFRRDEAVTQARVAIVSAGTASSFWPGQDPVGQTIRIERPEGRPVDELPGYSLVTVVGVVRDVVSGMIFDGTDPGHVYLPMTAQGPHAESLLVKPRSEGSLGPEALQQIFAKVTNDPEALETLPLDEMRALQVYPLQAASVVGSILGAIALILSVSGLYGVLSYMLTQRTREIGIRMALGATATAVVRLVMTQSARLAGIGIAAGLLVSFAALQTLNSAIRLRNITVLDLGAFAAGIVLVLVATALAAYRPARRATRVDPAVTLRAEG